MKKYESFDVEILRNICLKATSFREIATQLGYSPDGGSGIQAVKEMIGKYDFETPLLTGQSHSKNTGKYRTPIEDYLTNKVQTTSFRLRNRLISEGIFEWKCNRCGNTHWLEEETPLELHHKDGNKNNNSLENLELLCPNCHYFTDTYKSKNWNKG